MKTTVKIYASPKDLIEKVMAFSEEKAVNEISYLEMLENVRKDTLEGLPADSPYKVAQKEYLSAKRKMDAAALSALKVAPIYSELVRGIVRGVIIHENPGTDYPGDGATTSFDYLESQNAVPEWTNDMSTAARISSYIFKLTKDFAATTKVKRIPKKTNEPDVQAAALKTVAEMKGISIEELIQQLGMS